MATAYLKRFLSGSTNGRPIKVVQTATAGTLIHTGTAKSGADDNADEVWLWACNTSSSPILLTLEWGGTSAPDDHIKQTIPANSTICVAPGLLIQNGLVIRAFAGSANLVTIAGFVNRADV